MSAMEAVVTQLANVVVGIETLRSETKSGMDEIKAQGKPPSASGSKLTANTYDKMNVALFSLSVFPPVTVEISVRRDAFFCVSKYVSRIRWHRRHQLVDEVSFVQPLSLYLLRQLAKIFFRQEVRVDRNVRYQTEEFTAHGINDAGMFMQGSDLCIFSWEDQNLEKPLGKPEAAQAVAEVAGFAERLHTSTAFTIPNGASLCGVLTNGSDWAFIQKTRFQSGFVFLRCDVVGVIRRDGSFDPQKLNSLCDHVIYMFCRTRSLIDALKMYLANNIAAAVSLGEVNGDDDGSGDKTPPPSDGAKDGNDDAGNVAVHFNSLSVCEKPSAQKGGQKKKNSKRSVDRSCNDFLPLSERNLLMLAKLMPKKRPGIY
jgi:hypothetical protein